MVAKLLLLAILPFSLFGLSFEEVNNKPMSLAKDYYIFTLLEDKNTTAEQAKVLMEQVSRMNNKMFLRAAQKHQDEGIRYVAACLQNNKEAFLKSDTDCKAIRVSVAFFLGLNKTERLSVKKELQSAYPNDYAWMDTIEKSNKEILKSEHFLYIFTNATNDFREKLDQRIDKKRLIELSSQKGFDNFVNRVLSNDKLTLTRASFIKIFPEEVKTNFQVSFWWGIIAVELDSPQIASHWFEISAKQTANRYFKDRATFWQYLCLNDNKFLEELANNRAINFYTILAREKLGLTPHKIVQHQEFDELKLGDINKKDPFEWATFQRKIINTSREELYVDAYTIRSYAHMPHYYYMLGRMNRAVIPYFIVPYEEHLSAFTNKEKSLTLATARQESLFLPAVVSTSYALGMMQFMDFTANAVAKRMKFDEFEIDMLFDPKVAYKMGTYHLNELLKQFGHPLFVAYAYNAGAGFTRRMLEKRDLFYVKGKYEPFLSMEKLPIAETREYGKHVLANYVVYMRSFGEKTSMQDLLQKLKLRFGSHPQ